MKHWKSILLLGVLVGSGLVAEGQQLRCEPPEDDISALGGISIESGKLMVSVSWGERILAESFAVIEVRDRDGVTVASKVASRQEEGRAEYQVTNDPGFFTNNGYWYSIHLTDPLGRDLVPSVPATISLCRQGEGCTYRVVESLGSDGLSMSSRMHLALKKRVAQGSKNLLGDTLTRDPSLAHEVYWVADQIGRLTSGTNTSNCLCLWYSESEQNPPVPVLDSQSGPTLPGQPNPLWQTLKVEGSGGNFGLAGQAHGGPALSMAASGEAWAGLHLGCWRVRQWVPGAWLGVSINLPVLDPCARSCTDAAVEVEASLKSHSAANAWASSGRGARGATSSSVELYLNGASDPALAVSTSAVADRLAGDLTEAPVEDFPDASLGEWESLAPGTIVSIGAKGTFEVSLENPISLSSEGSGRSGASDGGGPSLPGAPWAYGCAISSSSAVLVGKASCAVENRLEVNLQPTFLTYTQEGLLIVPWHP